MLNEKRVENALRVYANNKMDNRISGIRAVLAVLAVLRFLEVFQTLRVFGFFIVTAIMVTIGSCKHGISLHQ